MQAINRFSHWLVGSYTRPAFVPSATAALEPDVIVPDISFWQDRNDTLRKVDFIQMRAALARGVIIRVGQGNWTDEDYADYWQAARNVLPRGLYWFYDSRYNPLLQAGQVAALIEKHGAPEMELWADYEENYGGSYKGWRHFAVFLAELQRLLPKVRIGIYTGYYYWLDHSPNPITQKASFQWFAQFPLWLAWYTSNPAIVKIPKPWSSLLYWQKTDKGDGPLYGVESKNIDLSRFNGTRADFDTRYTMPVPTPEPVTPPAVVPTLAPGIYRIKHDREMPANLRPPRSTGWKAGKKLRGLPETVRVNGGRGTVELPEAWVKYLDSINSVNARRYLRKLRSGWLNQGPFPKMEELTFSGNYVGVTKIEGGRAYIETLSIGDKPPVSLNEHNEYIHRFSVVYNDGSYEMATPVGNVFTLVICNPSEVGRMWIDLARLEKVA